VGTATLQRDRPRQNRIEIDDSLVAATRLDDEPLDADSGLLVEAGRYRLARGELCVLTQPPGQKRPATPAGRRFAERLNELTDDIRDLVLLHGTSHISWIGCRCGLCPCRLTETDR
jgi:hypothetical protein